MIVHKIKMIMETIIQTYCVCLVDMNRKLCKVKTFRVQCKVTLRICDTKYYTCTLCNIYNRDLLFKGINGPDTINTLVFEAAY